MPLKLAVPSADGNANPNAETRPKQVKDWLDMLPKGQPFEASRMARDGLATLNRQKLAPDQRLKLLELYGETIHALLPAIAATYSGVALPLPEKNRQAANLARELYVELAYGYKLALLELANKRFGTGRLLPQATRGALAALANILVVCYQTYAPTPAGIWSEMHQLYQFAVEEGIQGTVPEGGGNSVAHTYKQALLLALADPYRLMQGEVGKTLDYLARFGDRAQLAPLATASHGTGVFLVRLDSDKPPRPLPQDRADADAHTDLLLLTLELARLLHQQLTRLEAGEAPSAFGLPEEARESGYPGLMRRLIRHWGVAPKRHFNRIRNQATVDICVGLRAIHYFLNGQTPFQPPETGAAPEGDITIAAVAPMAGATAGRHFDSGRWEIVNESAGGLALRMISGDPLHIRVGEVVGLKTGQGDDWSIGAVRWVQSDNPEHLEVGIQMLAPNALPTEIKPTIAAAGDITQPALLLPEMPVLKQPAALLAPRGLYRNQREYRVGHGGGAKTVRAVKLLEQTVGYELFQFG